MPYVIRTRVPRSALDELQRRLEPGQRPEFLAADALARAEEVIALPGVPGATETDTVKIVIAIGDDAYLRIRPLAAGRGIEIPELVRRCFALHFGS
jgi:hypothetical protein